MDMKGHLYIKFVLKTAKLAPYEYGFMPGYDSDLNMAAFL